MGPLRLMRNHRPLLSTMCDGMARESRNRFRSGTRLSKRLSMAVASVNLRNFNFLREGPTVDPTGDTGRLREYLCQGVHE